MSPRQDRPRSPREHFKGELCRMLGVPTSAQLSEGEILAALEEALNESSRPIAPQGQVFVTSAELQRLTTEAALAPTRAQDNEAKIEAALVDGRLVPESVDRWRANLAADPNAGRVLDALVAIPLRDAPRTTPRGRSLAIATALAPSSDIAEQFARNPLADELQRQDPKLYQVARALNRPPTLFASGDLPPFVASGIDVSLLLNVPWRARPALALMDTRSTALAAYNVWTTDAGLAEVEAGAYEGARAVIIDYTERFQAWVRQGWRVQDSALSDDDQVAQLSAVMPGFARAHQQAQNAARMLPERPSSGAPPGWTRAN